MGKVTETQGFQTPPPLGDAGARLKDLQSLSADIVRFFRTQIFAPGVYASNEDVCQVFSDILLRHWNLCAIVTFMRDGAEQPLRQFHIHVSENLDQEKARAAAAALLAAAVENTGEEQQVWLDQKPTSEQNQSTFKLKRIFKEAGLSSGIGVPIYAHGATPVGVLVAMASSPVLPDEAIDGIRLIVEPLIIAVANAQHMKAIHEQRRQIEHLVEELEQSNAALRDANLQLQRVSLYRSLFLARMSHELRTPLTSILGFAEILLDQERLTETQQRFCEKIQSSGLQLQSSLKQLVDLSRLEAGRTEMFLHEFSLRETLRESCSAVSPLARKRQVHLDCQSALDLPPIVSDEGKMRQVFYNFLAHAIARSAPGQNIFVSATRPDAHGFAVVIRDEGERVANPSIVFESMDALEPGAAGTNLNELGLSIARRLVDALGGAVRLDSAEPRGLSVRLEFPASL